jgi:RimJ/RimL family protein N-acetyltransferase
MHFNFEDHIILENDNLLMRPIIAEDFDHLRGIAAEDPGLLRFSPRQIYTPGLLKEYIEAAIILRKQGSRYSFSIFNKQLNCYAGSTSFLNISNSDDRLEIGATWLGKSFQGTGLNRQCKFLLLQYAFEQLDAYRVEFKTDERNLRSKRALEKIGAIFEGSLRQHTRMEDGFRRNTHCYSILQPDWQVLKYRLENPVGEMIN